MFMTWKNTGLAPENETPNPQVPAGGNGTPPPPATREARVVTMQRGTLAKQMRGEREKGKQEALSGVEARAKALGFGSVDEMFARQEREQRRASQQARQPQQQRRAEPTRGTSPAETRRFQREIERRDRVIDDERRARIFAERKRKAEQQERYALEAEVELERIAHSVGIRDVDVALALYTKAVKNKTSEELEKMNEEEWFKDLRSSRPYLFGETVEPANTGSGRGNPAPPSPPQVVRQATRNGKFDARNATKEELDAHYKRLGLKKPY